MSMVARCAGTNPFLAGGRALGYHALNYNTLTTEAQPIGQA